MPGLYQKFHAALASQGYVTNGQVYRKLAEGNAAENDFVKSFKGKPIFAGFNALSGAEAKIFKDSAGYGQSFILFRCRSLLPDGSPSEAGLF